MFTPIMHKKIRKSIRGNIKDESVKHRFLVDENLPQSLTEFLKGSGFVVKRVSEVNLKGAKDETIADYALRNKYIMITLDKDFGYIYHHIYKGRLTVIIIRVKPPTPTKIISAINQMLRKIDLNRYRGRLIIVAEKRMRII